MFVMPSINEEISSSEKLQTIFGSKFSDYKDHVEVWLRFLPQNHKTSLNGMSGCKPGVLMVSIITEYEPPGMH